MTITEFIEARLAEWDDEARDAALVREQAFGRTKLPDFSLRVCDDAAIPAVLVGPELVLAQVAALRAVVALHDVDCEDAEYGPFVATTGPTEIGADSVGVWERAPIGTQEWLGCPELRHIAAIWADHPDYLGDWKP